MNFITTTDLRTKSSELIDALEQGCEITLVHRSKIVAVIKPKKQLKTLKAIDINQLKKLAQKLNLPKMSYEDREKNYRKTLRDNYGESLS